VQEKQLELLHNSHKNWYKAFTQSAFAYDSRALQRTAVGEGRMSFSSRALDVPIELLGFR
jgi:hypothetical protein